MGKESLPFIFGSADIKMTIIQTTQWLQNLQSAASAYQDCHVKTFTRVKNLNSDYQHEYVQFIVEHRPTGDRARVYADRANEEIVDVVILGWDRDEKPKSPKTPDQKQEKQELPLPLTSLKFGKGKEPTVLELAKILAAITTVGGGYKLYENNCFWFAALAYKVVKAAFGGGAEEKHWRWINPGGHGGGGLNLIKDMYGLGFPWIFYYAFMPGAKEFQIERRTKTEWGLKTGADRVEITPEEFTKNIVDGLLTEDELADYKEWKEFDGSEFDESMLTLKADAALQSAKLLSENPDLSITENLDEHIYNLTNQVLENPKQESLQQVFDDVAKENAKNSTTEPLPAYDGPRHADFAKLEMALNSLAGEVLLQSGNVPSQFLPSW